MDCVEAMRKMPDNAFDLAVCDPPYGDAISIRSQNVQVERERAWNRFGGRFDKYKRQTLDEVRGMVRQVQDGCTPRCEYGNDGKPVSRTGGTWAAKYGKKIIAWDVAPEEEYWEQLFRVSRNQVIWGGNYFWLPPTRCFLVWEKLSISESFSMAMCEYAWTSFNGNAKLFKAAPQGSAKEPRIHACQKPVDLYKWVYKMFAKQGDTILDTHLGSGSSRIAAWDMGLDFVGYEIDPHYFALEEKRFHEHSAQIDLVVEMGLDITGDNNAHSD